MVAKDFASVADIHHIERMEQVLPAYIDSVIAVFEDIYNAFAVSVTTLHHRTHTKGGMLHIVSLVHILKEVKAELVQAEIHDVDAGVHIFKVNNLFLQSFELVAAILQVAFFLVGKQVIIAC